MSEATEQPKPLELGELAVEYGHWREMPGHEPDRWGTFKMLAEIYQFAISRYNDPGVELLLEALATAEAAVEEDRREQSKA